jgi:hypothetical protein
MSFQNLSKGSVLYIEALDPFAIDTTNNSFDYKGAPVVAPGNTYDATTANRNGLAYADRASAIKFRRVTEHNRSPLSFNVNRIEQSNRMANGTTRKYFIADKLNINVSWEMVPSFRNETVDGAWGAEDLKAFYESIAGRGSFRIKLNPTVFSPDLIQLSGGALEDDYTYTVMFTSCDFTLIKRGIQPFWSVDISLEQV